MSDMHQTIVPKSDQLNADDLIGRELTIKITGVDIKGGQEQPVSIHFEGDGGKPYKACKSMCRVMVSAWGPDSKKYVGRSLTLYRDPKVKWGGMEVGGIRISHMSDIADDMTMALTVTRANKKPFTVRPIEQATTKPAVLADVLKAIEAAKTPASLKATATLAAALPDETQKDMARQAYAAKAAALASEEREEVAGQI
jgi:hypothetical protein